MSEKFSLSSSNEHYNQPTPQGSMLQCLLDAVGSVPNVWYADTFSLPNFGNLKKYYSGSTVILYCWWDPADDRIKNLLDNMDINFIIITSDPELSAKHNKIKTVPWKYQYGFHFNLIKNTAPAVHCDTGTFLCMMRNHKPERLLFLEQLWESGLLESNLVSYLGEVNTRAIHGRTPRPMQEIVAELYQADTNFTYQPSDKFAEWLVSTMPVVLQGDETRTHGNNTDFFTCGNPNWYANTQYSIVLETYWTNTEFLTEKTFKPIVAKHPFVNLGNNSNKLLESLGFDVFPEVFGCDFYDGLQAPLKTQAVIPKLTSVDIDPVRCELNYQCGMDLLNQARNEQKYLATQAINLL